MKNIFIFISLIVLSSCIHRPPSTAVESAGSEMPPVLDEDIVVKRTSADLAKIEQSDSIWNSAPVKEVGMMAQPMVVPRPAQTMTDKVLVQALHDGSWISFRLRWACAQKSEAGKLGTFSDAVAIQFPVKDNANPPPIFMGMKDNPVHIFHWRAQYQLDEEKSMRTMKDLYPNMNPDMYPLEFKDEGHLSRLTDEKREVFSHGRAAGNPQSYAKKGIDEIFAEGFGTSSVIKNVESIAQGEWKDGEWTVIISRPLKREDGSLLTPGVGSFAAFAVWQGAQDEVGSRKSLTMNWTPLKIEK